MGKTNRNRAFPLSDLEGLSFPFLRPEIEGSFCRCVWFVCCAQFWLHGVSEPGLEIAEERKRISHHESLFAQNQNYTSLFGFSEPHLSPPSIFLVYGFICMLFASLPTPLLPTMLASGQWSFVHIEYCPEYSWCSINVFE